MGHWLSYQHDVTSGDSDESLKLVEMWRVDHVQIREDDTLIPSNRFSISESGMIGISCYENPSLSVCTRERINHLLYYQMTRSMVQLHLSRFLTKNTWLQPVRKTVVYI